MSSGPDDVLFEDDPTGMRALLSGLPDPGPMPPDVADRILAALRAEATNREEPAGEIAPVVPLPPKTADRQGSTVPKARRRSSPRAWLLPAAAVALMSVGGGYALQALRESSIGANSTAASSEPVAGRAESGVAQQPPDSKSSAPASDSAFSSSALVAEAERFIARLSDSTPSEAARTGFALDDPATLRACAAALGAAEPAKAHAQAGTFSGAPAALVVFPGDSGWIANIVGTGCGSAGANRLAGPETIGTGTKTP